MKRTLHCANGDMMVEALRAAVTDDVEVWREILCEGPITSTVATDEFWAARSAFISEAYGERDAEYRRKVVASFQNLTTLGAYDKIVLWFDEDLHCMVNFAFLCYHLRPCVGVGTEVCLVCAPDVSDPSTLLPTMITLTTSEMAYAAMWWRAYASDDPLAFDDVMLRDCGRLQVLRERVQTHQQRYPHINADQTPLQLPVYLGGYTITAVPCPWVWDKAAGRVILVHDHNL